MFLFLHLEFGELKRTEAKLPGQRNLSMKQEPGEVMPPHSPYTTASHIPPEQFNFMHRERFDVGGENTPSCHSVVSAISQLLPSAVEMINSLGREPRKS